MDIPERMDKWLVFLGLVLLTEMDLLHSTGLNLDVFGWVLIPLAAGFLGMLTYIGLRALCRLLGRLFGREKGLRTFVNCLCVVLLVLSTLPVLDRTVRVDLPHRVEIHRP